MPVLGSLSLSDRTQTWQCQLANCHCCLLSSKDGFLRKISFAPLVGALGFAPFCGYSTHCLIFKNVQLSAQAAQILIHY